MQKGSKTKLQVDHHVTLKMLVKFVGMTFVQMEKWSVNHKHSTGTLAIANLLQPWCLLGALLHEPYSQLRDWQLSQIRTVYTSIKMLSLVFNERVQKLQGINFNSTSPLFFKKIVHCSFIKYIYPGTYRTSNSSVEKLILLFCVLTIQAAFTGYFCPSLQQYRLRYCLINQEKTIVANWA